MWFWFVHLIIERTIYPVSAQFAGTEANVSRRHAPLYGRLVAEEHLSAVHRREAVHQVSPPFPFKCFIRSGLFLLVKSLSSMNLGLFEMRERHTHNSSYFEFRVELSLHWLIFGHFFYCRQIVQQHITNKYKPSKKMNITKKKPKMHVRKQRLSKRTKIVLAFAGFE